MEVTCALVKDLRSTGYFFDELKSYSQSPEMDLTTYCVDLAIPYLARISEGYDRSGHPDKGKIFRFAGKFLSECNGDLTSCIFGLKKVASSEIDRVHKEAREDQLAKAKSLANRQSLQSAELLHKLLATIIKMFRLAAPNVDRKKEDRIEDPIGDNIVHAWETME
ncbi:MAG: hypothetical protein ABFD97_00800 [Syntrophobacter sp.]